MGRHRERCRGRRSRQPAAQHQWSGDSYYKHNNIFATSYAQATIAKDFTLKTQFGYETFQERHKYTGGVNETYSFSRNFVVNPRSFARPGTPCTYENEYYNWKWTNTLNWNHTFAKVHDVAALVGFEEGRYKKNNIDTNKYGLLDKNITDLNTVTKMEYINGAGTEYAFRSWFGRVNYAFDSKYLLEANFRYDDGSSPFAPDDRSGFFPSVSGGWRISEEAFAKNSFLSVFDNLKLRASWGKLGNAAVDNYAYQSWYETGYTVMNGKKAPALLPNQLPNINVTWEKTSTFDVGLDFSVLGGRLSGVLDYYSKNTDGILISPSIGLTYGDKKSPAAEPRRGEQQGIRGNTPLGRPQGRQELRRSGERSMEPEPCHQARARS